MSVHCMFCESEFSQKFNLERHLKQNKCKAFEALSAYDVYKKMEKEVQAKVEKAQEDFRELNVHGDQNNVLINSSQNFFNINIEIQVNPVNRLDTSVIEPSKMKFLIEKYIMDERGKLKAKDKDTINILLSDYVKTMICDKEHPENIPVKYISKKPPTYNIVYENEDGKVVNIIKGLRDTCELLSDPVLNALKRKLKECVVEVKDQATCNFDCALKELRKELNKENVKRALSSVLQNDILHDIEMKLSVTKVSGEYS
uniref:Uncharacterized protein n=1 Tax=viral metagenome TaxID=1070528 RepID=A0A6C0H6P4_9ZZZZ